MTGWVANIHHTFQSKIPDFQHPQFPLFLEMCCVSLVNKDINLMITKPIYIQTLSPEYTKEKQSEELLAEFMLRMVVGGGGIRLPAGVGL